MIEQLELQFVSPGIQGGSEGQTFHRYMVLDCLDQLYGRTALVHYDDGFMAFSVPVMIGEMEFSTVSTTGLNIIRLRAENSVINLGASHLLSSLILQNGILQAVSRKRSWENVAPKRSNKSTMKISDGIPGISKIELLKMDALNRAGKSLKENFSPPTLIGKVVQVVLNIPDDWIGKVLTLPFIVQDLKIHGGQFLLSGSHGAAMKYRGVVGCRHSDDYTIIDIRDTRKYMDRSFHIWYTTPKYL